MAKGGEVKRTIYKIKRKDNMKKITKIMSIAFMALGGIFVIVLIALVISISNDKDEELVSPVVETIVSPTKMPEPTNTPKPTEKPIIKPTSKPEPTVKVESAKEMYKKFCMANYVGDTFTKNEFIEMCDCQTEFFYKTGQDNLLGLIMKGDNGKDQKAIDEIIQLGALNCLTMNGHVTVDEALELMGNI